MRSSASREQGLRQGAGRFLQSYGLLIMTLILVAIFALLNDRFLTGENFRNILEQNAALAIVAVGVTFTIISGNFDLSPGSTVALAGVILALIYRATGSMPLAILAGIGTCLLLGLFYGSLISYVKINSVIVTLSAMIWARGLALGLTNADSVPFQSRFVEFMNGALFPGISPIILLIVLAYAIGWFFLSRTRLGRYTYALGGDVEATKAAGINTNLYVLLIFLLSAAFVGIATVVTVSRLSAGTPGAVYGLEFDAIVAVIIGGASMSGGEGSLGKTIVGVLFIAILNNGLSTMGMRDAYFFLYKGGVILLALFIEVASRRILRGRSALAAGSGA